MTKVVEDPVWAEVVSSSMHVSAHEQNLAHPCKRLGKLFAASLAVEQAKNVRIDKWVQSGSIVVKVSLNGDLNIKSEEFDPVSENLQGASHHY